MKGRLKTTSLVFILVLIEIYFLVNGQAHFENWGDYNKQVITMYILMVVAFMIFSGRETEAEMGGNRELPLTHSVVNFVVFFIATYFIMMAVTTLSGSVISPMAPELFWPTIIMQVCVVATSEELMFRGVVLEHFGVLVSALLFAGWHVYAYGFQFYGDPVINIYPFIVAFFMGIILALLVKRKEFGLPTVIAIHSAYNCFVAGCFITWGML